VIAVKHQSSTAFEDKDQIWADNASSSRFFGHVYVCFAEYRGNGNFQNGNEPAPLVVATSIDGGSTWSKKQLNPAATNPQSQQGFGTSACTIRTDSHGVVYLFADQFAWGLRDRLSRPVPVLRRREVLDPRPPAVFGERRLLLLGSRRGSLVSDGIAGSRIDLSPSPSVDIANGAPTGEDATNEIVDSWVDGRAGFNNEEVLFSFSTDGAKTFFPSSPVRGAASTPRRPSLRTARRSTWRTRGSSLRSRTTRRLPVRR
jgi:hypothetical protein